MVMTQAFHTQLKFEEKTSTASRLAPQIEAQFKALRKGLEEVRGFWTHKSPERLRQGTEASRNAMEALFVTFDQLKAEEEAAPKLSPSPFLHQLLKVGT